MTEVDTENWVYFLKSLVKLLNFSDFGLKF